MLTRFVPSTKEPLPMIGLGTIRAFDTWLGPGNPDHMRANLTAGEGLIPDAAMRRRMSDLFDNL